MAQTAILTQSLIQLKIQINKMKLTHHLKSTRSFILIAFIVLLTVYTAVVLTRIQMRATMNELSTVGTMPKNQQYDTSDWQKYQDPAYPISISYPETWTYSADIKTLPGFYTINLFPKDSKNSVRIYISEEDFVAVDNLKGNQQTIAKNLTVTNYQDLIYTIKVGDYFYTFDGTLADQYQAELSEIVRLARFE